MKNILGTLLSLLCHGQSNKLFTTDNELYTSSINRQYLQRHISLHLCRKHKKMIIYL